MFICAALCYFSCAYLFMHPREGKAMGDLLNLAKPSCSCSAAFPVKRLALAQHMMQFTVITVAHLPFEILFILKAISL